jgi:catechol 2,3-dioxygenase-like lactoylglutathione lyase family enzyme
MAMNASSLSVSLTVKDVRASLAWYRDVLGFAVNQEYERGGALRAVSISAGVARVLLSQDDGAKGADRAKGDGISLMLTTAESIDEIAARVKSRGGTLDSEPADAFGRRAFRLRDPDGFRLTISSEQHA